MVFSEPQSAEGHRRAGLPDAGSAVLRDGRIASLDVLRGFAVLAIFSVNIKAMAMPLPYYVNPAAWAGGVDQIIAVVQRVLVDDKWVTVFAGLYGAGLVLLAERPSSEDRNGALLLRRNGWLVFLGAVHLILIWDGDILMVYGVTGLLAMRFVALSQSALVTVSIGLLVVGTAWQSALGMLPLVDPTLFETLYGKAWNPDGQAVAEEILTFRNGFLSRVGMRADAMVGTLIWWSFGGGVWFLLGIMTAGMAILRHGLRFGKRGESWTVMVGSALLAGAFGLDAAQLAFAAGSSDPFRASLLVTPVAAVDGLIGGLGYALVVIGVAGRLPLHRRLAAVGRVAFSAYLLCSLVGVGFAAAGGGAAFGSSALWHLQLVVAATAIALLGAAPMWLKRYRFGPAEWLWRSATYGAWQPLKASETTSSGVGRAER